MRALEPWRMTLAALDSGLPMWRLRALLSMLALCLVLLAGGDTGEVFASFNAASPVTLSTKAVNTVADTTITTTIPSGDYNFSLIAWGTPSLATLAHGPDSPGFNGSTEPALGDAMGTFTTTASYLGFSDTPCSANVTRATFVLTS